jgi:hypothetical protein
MSLSFECKSPGEKSKQFLELWWSSHVTGPRFVSDSRHDAWKNTKTAL